MNMYHLQTHRSTILVIVVWFSMMQTDPRCGKIRAYIHFMHVIWDRWGVHATNIVICRCWIWITHITGRVCARATEISMSNCSYERRLLNVIYFPFNLFWKTDGISQMNVCVFGLCRKWVWHFNKILFMYEEKKRIQDFHDARAASIWMRILSLGLIVLRVRFDRLLNFRILSRVCWCAGGNCSRHSRIIVVIHSLSEVIAKQIFNGFCLQFFNWIACVIAGLVCSQAISLVHLVLHYILPWPLKWNPTYTQSILP